MERTNEELKDELLRVYRYTFGLVNERDRQRNNLIIAKRKLKEAEAELEHQIGQNANLRKRNRALDDENIKFHQENFVQYETIEATLDLIGAVIEQEAMAEHHWKLLDFAVASEPENTEMPGPRPRMRAKDEKVRPPEPTLCLSCGEEKGSYFYLCEVCFELSGDLETDIFSELSSAWDKGDRDFPRPGKNARTIQVSESEGER